jgi:hypothetical protein
MLALNMLDYLIAVSLVLLIAGHTLLIKGCTQISLSLQGVQDEGEGIQSQTGRISELLDELIQVVVDAMPEPSNDTALTHPPQGLGGMVATLLMNRMNMSQDQGEHSDGYEKEQIREIYTNETPSEVATEI